MMKQWKKILTALLVIALAAVAYGYYLYNKKPADVRKQSADYELTAEALLADYNKDETAANLKYLDKVIAVKGKVAEVKLDTASRQATVILDTGDPMAAVTCSFYEEETAAVRLLSPGTQVIIKGKCTGKLMDVVLNKCSIEK
jgi:RecG-like helicase